MMKWFTSMLLLFAVTGQVWAGVCGCFDDHGDSDPCCKPDRSGITSIAPEPCCPADCEAVSGTQIPGKNADRVAADTRSGDKRDVSAVPAAIFFFQRTLVARSVPTVGREGNRLKLARHRDGLYLRHNALLI